MPYTNILALPLAHVTIETSNTEDWVDVFKYITPDDKQIDLRGIEFDMQIRRRRGANEVVLYASTDNRWLSLGAAPNFGNLIICVPEREMRGHFAGEYVGDIRARDRNHRRVCVTIDLVILEGVTKTRVINGITAV